MKTIIQTASQSHVSPFRGTYWYRPYQKWTSSIGIHGKRTHLGYFDTAEEAHEAYKRAGGENRVAARTALIETARKLEESLGPLTRVIPLTKGQVTLVDAADYDWLMQWRWCPHWSPASKTLYAYRNIRDGSGSRIMHRAILDAPATVEVDHKNGDGLCNLRSNLRLATDQQNKYNKGIQSNNTSGYRGVTLHASNGTWRARIEINGKYKHLGLFNTPQLASEAYESAAKELQGDFYRQPGMAI